MVRAGAHPDCLWLDARMITRFGGRAFSGGVWAGQLPAFLPALPGRRAKGRMPIHELKGWPRILWDSGRLTTTLASIRHPQGKRIARMGSLGFSLRQEAALRTLASGVLESGGIEGEKLGAAQVCCGGRIFRISAGSGYDTTASTPLTGWASARGNDARLASSSLNPCGPACLVLRS